ncbi:WhiB family transcriptional regulator [Streptomyces rectiviolaceus]|uniref:WhiB family transcriptional regulator n=1 Tax=Streptomyces rectiviolaceus TaxID=332591 RepID=UPI00362FBB46
MTHTTAAARISPEHARQDLVDHPHYRYRGCAPDPDQPTQAAGNPDLTLDAWEGQDIDGAENQIERRERQAAAIEVCIDCPVMARCLTYARTYRVETGADGTQKAVLTEPSGVLGGMTSLERHREFITAQHRIVAPAPDARLRTAQKMALLTALAAHTHHDDVARAAGMDLRTANWHRSALTTLLGLNKKTALRQECSPLRWSAACSTPTGSSPTTGRCPPSRGPDSRAHLPPHALPGSTRSQRPKRLTARQLPAPSRPGPYLPARGACGSCAHASTPSTDSSNSTSG